MILKISAISFTYDTFVGVEMHSNDQIEIYGNVQKNKFSLFFSNNNSNNLKNMNDIFGHECTFISFLERPLKRASTLIVSTLYIFLYALRSEW